MCDTFRARIDKVGGSPVPENTMSFLPSLIRSFMKRCILAKMAPPPPAPFVRFDLRPLRLQSTSPREQLNQGVYTVTYLLGVRDVNIDKLARLHD